METTNTEITEVTTLLDESDLTTVGFETTTETVTTVLTDVPTEVDGELVNNFCTLGITFIVACFFWWGVKYTYRLFRIFI